MAQNSLAIHLLEKFTEDREKIERYAALAQLCPLPAFILAHDNATIVYINPAYHLLTGRTIEELQDGKWIDLVIHPDDREPLRAVWKLFTYTSRCAPHWHRYLHVDGTVTDTVTILDRVEGNGYVGFIVPQCGSTAGCPMSIFSKKLLSTEASFSRNFVPELVPT